MSNSVVRALRILELLGHSEKPLSLSQVCTELSIPKSTAHGILGSLVQEGFAEVTEHTTYVIGLKAFEVGSAHLRTTGTVGVVAPELAKLTRLLNVTAHWAVLDGTDVVYLCKEDPPVRGIQLASAIGARLPAQVTAVGKSCLAWLPDEQVAPHLTVPAGQDATRVHARVAEELAKVREEGYSTDDGQAAAAIQCLAAPVFDLTGPRGAIGVSYLRDSEVDVDTFIAEVVSAASRATSLLGGRNPR
jgi:DNA-binding IclR family transcriptional regulator